jgi:hypothetical protein
LPSKNEGPLGLKIVCKNKTKKATRETRKRKGLFRRSRQRSVVGFFLFNYAFKHGLVTESREHGASSIILR